MYIYHTQNKHITILNNISKRRKPKIRRRVGQNYKKKMKRRIYLVLATVALVICGCNFESSEIEYLPCKVEKNDDWGFVNAKGDIFCKDAFKNAPTEVRNGIFFIQEDDAYAMYQFDKKKPKLILDGISHFGRTNEGLVPICKEDSRIEIVDLNGTTKFMLDKIDGQEVISCAPSFKFGLLIVRTMNKEGERHYGVVNKSGKVVLRPKYKDITILDANLFYVNSYNNGEEQEFFIDKNGKKQTQWNKDTRIECTSDKYIATEHNDRYYVYDKKGNEILKCPSKVKSIEDIRNDFLKFKSEDYDYGVMDMKGEIIVPAKYAEIAIVDNGFIVKRNEDRNLELLDKKGELISEIDDLDYAFNINGFGNVGAEGRSNFYILDDEFRPLNKIEFHDIDIYDNYSYIQSEYFDYGAVIAAVKEALEGELKKLTFGTSVISIERVTSKGTAEYSRYTYTTSIKIAQGVKYSVNANLVFDEKILSPIYKEKRVEKYSWYYGTYYTTETVVDGYKFNQDSKLEEINITCDIPYAKEDKMREELDKFLIGFASKDKDGTRHKDGRKYSLYDLTISINPYNAPSAE